MGLAVHISWHDSIMAENEDMTELTFVSSLSLLVEQTEVGFVPG